MDINSNNRRSFRDLTGREAPPPLWTLLPQTVPYGFIIDPTNLCNFKCPFCPTGNEPALRAVARPRGVMKFELFERIIAGLSALTLRHSRKVRHLQLWKDGEPLLHPRILEMIQIAKSAQVADSVELTTNLSWLKRTSIRDLANSGLDVLRISVEHVDEAAYRGMTNGKHGYEDIRANVETLFREKQSSAHPMHLHVKIVDTGLTSSQKRKFIEDFAPMSDSWNIESLAGWSLTQIQDFRLGEQPPTALDGFTPRSPRVVCPEPFAKLAVNYNGMVSVCCVDWSHGTLVGDANVETIEEIWNGEKLNGFRLRHLRAQRSTIPACANCDFLEGFPVFSNLDDHRAELLQVFSPAVTRP